MPKAKPVQHQQLKAVPVVLDSFRHYEQPVNRPVLETVRHISI
jgi:hypothetical protein